MMIKLQQKLKTIGSVTRLHHGFMEDISIVQMSLKAIETQVSNGTTCSIIKETLSEAVTALKNMKELHTVDAPKWIIEMLIYRCIGLCLKLRIPMEAVELMDIMWYRLMNNVKIDRMVLLSSFPTPSLYTSDTIIAMIAGAASNSCHALLMNYETTKKISFLYRLAKEADAAAHWSHVLGTTQHYSKAVIYLDLLCDILYRAGNIYHHDNIALLGAKFECGTRSLLLRAETQMHLRERTLRFLSMFCNVNLFTDRLLKFCCHSATSEDQSVKSLSQFRYVKVRSGGARRLGLSFDKSATENFNFAIIPKSNSKIPLLSHSAYLSTLRYPFPSDTLKFYALSQVLLLAGYLVSSLENLSWIAVDTILKATFLPNNTRNYTQQNRTCCPHEICQAIAICGAMQIFFLNATQAVHVAKNSALVSDLLFFAICTFNFVHESEQRWKKNAYNACVQHSLVALCSAFQVHLRIEPFVSRLVFYDCHLFPKSSFLQLSHLSQNCEFLWNVPYDHACTIGELILRDLESLLIDSMYSIQHERLRFVARSKLFSCRSHASSVAQIFSTCVFVDNTPKFQKKYDTSLYHVIHGTDTNSVENICDYCASFDFKKWLSRNLREDFLDFWKELESYGSKCRIGMPSCLGASILLRTLTGRRHRERSLIHRWSSSMFVQRMIGRPIIQYMNEICAMFTSKSLLEKIPERRRQISLRKMILAYSVTSSIIADQIYQCSDILQLALSEAIVRCNTDWSQHSNPIYLQPCQLTKHNIHSRFIFGIATMNIRCDKIDAAIRLSLFARRWACDCYDRFKYLTGALQFSIRGKSLKDRSTLFVLYDFEIMRLRMTRQYRLLLKLMFNNDQKYSYQKQEQATLSIERNTPNKDNSKITTSFIEEPSISSDDIVFYSLQKHVFTCIFPQLEEFALYHYKCGQLILDSVTGLNLPSFVNLSQAVTFSLEGALVKLTPKILRTFTVASWLAGVNEIIAVYLIHQSCSMAYFRERSTKYDTIFWFMAKMKKLVFFEYRSCLNNVKVEFDLWFANLKIHRTWTITAACISSTGHLLICRSTESGHKIACLKLGIHFFDQLLESMSVLFKRLCLEQEKTPMSQSTHSSSTWWRSRHNLEIKFAKLLKVFDDNLSMVNFLFTPRLIDCENPCQLEYDDEATYLNRINGVVAQDTNCGHKIEPNFEVRLLQLQAKLRKVYFMSTEELRQELRSCGLSNVGRRYILTNRFRISMRKKIILFKHTLHNQRARLSSLGPIVMVLDEELQQLPFEALPYISSLSVSRVLDLDMVCMSIPRTFKGGKIIYQRNKAMFIIDPRHDLPSTRTVMSQVLNEHPWEWTGVVGARPSSLFVEASKSKDVILYCGHGDGREFFTGLSGQAEIRRGYALQKEREAGSNLTRFLKMNKIVTTLLIGCSSCQFHDNAVLLNFHFDNFSQYVIASLWDISDRDADRLTIDLIHGFTSTPMDALCNLLSDARTSCKLPLLNGSAFVCYGLPWLFKTL